MFGTDDPSSANNTSSLSKMQVIIQPLPRSHLLDRQARLAIRKRREEPEAPHQHANHNPHRRPGCKQALSSNSLPNRLTPLLLLLFRARLAVRDVEVTDVRGLDVEDEFDDGACNERGSEMCGEVVVQEELAAHDEEGDVVRCPEEEEKTCAIVEAGTCACVSLAPQHSFEQLDMVQLTLI